MDTFDILRKFGEYIHYDPDQKSFNLLTNDWMLHNAGKTITTICDRFDSSGRMAVLYAKKIYMKTIEEARVRLVDVLSHRDAFADETKMYDLFQGPEVEEIERNYMDALHQTILAITGKKELGERDPEQEKKVIYDSIETVTEQLGKCFKDVYINSRQPVDAIKNISTKIQLFNYMADCVLTLENKAPDGAYLCYISNNGTADGYFTIMIKSNGNLYSVNDRVSESYIGQHTRSRNGRWTEDHKDFFPYEAIMTFSDYDYKGYASKYNVDESRLSLADLSPEVYVPIVLAILCVINDQAGKPLDEKHQVYMNTLMRSNMAINTEGKALAKIDKTGLIEQTTKLLDIQLDPEKVKNGSYNKEFNIPTSGNGQRLVEYYGRDYKPSASYLSLKARNVLSDGKNDEPIHAEFIGSLEQMRRQAYYEARIDLAKHIEEKHRKELDAFGGLTKVYDWYSDKIRQNIPNLYPVLARLYSESKEQEDHWRKFIYREDDPEWIRHIRLLYEHTFCYDNRFIYNEPYRTDPRHYYPDYYLCPVTGNKASIWFAFEPWDDSDIAIFTGTDLAAPLHGWRNEFRSGNFYDGNSLLDTVDAVNYVWPLSRKAEGERVSFDYYVGFSKRGMNRLMKLQGETHE